MEKQSNLVKGIHSALDELEVLFIEGEELDLEVMKGLEERFEKLKKTVEQKNNK